MAYQSDSISTVVNRLNGQYFLPAIQREFVWQPSQIVELFDSIMRGYPISSFLFWELREENRDKWEIYRFISDFHQAGTHNELASAHGVHQLTLVLDGQQRLTSLLVGLKGSYTAKKKYKRWDSPDAYTKQTLFLNLLKDPTAFGENGEATTRYEFRFVEKQPKDDVTHHWFPVGRIMDFDNEDHFDEFRFAEREKLPDETTKKQIAVFERNLQRLYRAIWKDDCIAYHMEHDQDYDRVLDIFVRANEGGTKLSKSDLLLSMVTSKWGGMNAREEIYDFVDRINDQPNHKNDFDKDFVMKCCLVLSDLAVQYRVENFNNHNLNLIQSKWSEIKAAIEAGVKLANSFGIDRDTLTSANALIPVIYYLYKSQQYKRISLLINGNAAEDVENRRRIRRWLIVALLNRVFGGQSDTTLASARNATSLHLEGGSNGFPSAKIDVALDNRYDPEDILEITYQDKVAFLALSLLYDQDSWGLCTYQKDHIFPQAAFRPDVLTTNGLSPDQRQEYRRLSDSIANLQLLVGPENAGKSDENFEEWLTDTDDSYRGRHLIPRDDSLVRFDRFEDFVEAREQLITARLKAVLA